MSDKVPNNRLLDAGLELMEQNSKRLIKTASKGRANLAFEYAWRSASYSQLPSVDPGP